VGAVVEEENHEPQPEGGHRHRQLTIR